MEAPAHWRGACLGVELSCLPLPGIVSAEDVAVLSSDERSRASGFGAPSRRSEYVASRGRLRRTLSAVRGQTPESITIVVDEYGKPRLAADDLHFNLSHAADALLIGWGPRPLGVDLESARRTPRHIDRQPLLIEICDAHDGMGYIAAFTLVEAALKAVGRGLGIFKRLRLDRIGPAGECIFTAAGFGTVYAAAVPLPDDYVGAVAVVV
jgi:phosphopantetheinyl transferase